MFRVLILTFVIFSVAGHTKPQHPGHGHHRCTFSACESRVLVYQKPGKDYTSTPVLLCDL